MFTFKLNAGFLCNNNCIFCGQHDHKNLGNRSLKELLKDLEINRRKCDQLVLTGGEITLRKDLLKVINYARSLGYERIQLQTNGRLLSSLDFCEKLILAGVNEFAPSLHGHTSELHDSLTTRKGSFLETISGLKNLKKLDQYIITNSVIVSQNYQYLSDISKLLIDIGIDQYQLAFVHGVGNAFLNRDKIIPRLNDVVQFVKDALDLGISSNTKCMAESFPICLLIGYEKYCSEFYIPSTILSNSYQYDISFENTRKNILKTKGQLCLECVYYKQCEGIWKSYSDFYGFDELIPIKYSPNVTQNMTMEMLGL